MLLPDTDEFVRLNDASSDFCFETLSRCLTDSKIEYSNNRLIDVAMISLDDQKYDENLKSWSILEVSSQAIEIQLEFSDPLKVS